MELLFSHAKRDKSELAQTSMFCSCLINIPPYMLVVKDVHESWLTRLSGIAYLIELKFSIMGKYPLFLVLVPGITHTQTSVCHVLKSRLYGMIPSGFHSMGWILCGTEFNHICGAVNLNFWVTTGGRSRLSEHSDKKYELKRKEQEREWRTYGDAIARRIKILNGTTVTEALWMSEVSEQAQLYW